MIARFSSKTAASLAATFDAAEIIGVRFDPQTSGRPTTTVWLDAIDVVVPAHDEPREVAPASPGDPNADPPVPPTDTVTEPVWVPEQTTRTRLPAVTWGEEPSAVILQGMVRHITVGRPAHEALLLALYEGLEADGVIPAHVVEGEVTK